MQCGAQCFIVTFEKSRKNIQTEIIARTAPAARKKFKEVFGEGFVIKSVLKK